MTSPLRKKQQPILDLSDIDCENSSFNLWALECKDSELCAEYNEASISSTELQLSSSYIKEQPLSPTALSFNSKSVEFVPKTRSFGVQIKNGDKGALLWSINDIVINGTQALIFKEHLNIPLSSNGKISVTISDSHSAKCFKFRFKCNEISKNDQYCNLHKMVENNVYTLYTRNNCLVAFKFDVDTEYINMDDIHSNDYKKSKLKPAISDEFVCNDEMRVCLHDVVVRNDMDFNAPIIDHLSAGTPIVVEGFVVVHELTRAMISFPVNGWITAQKVDENGFVRDMITNDMELSPIISSFDADHKAFLMNYQSGNSNFWNILNIWLGFCANQSA